MSGVFVITLHGQPYHRTFGTEAQGVAPGELSGLYPHTLKVGPVRAFKITDMPVSIVPVNFCVPTTYTHGIDHDITDLVTADVKVRGEFPDGVVPIDLNPDRAWPPRGPRPTNVALGLG